MNGPDEIQVDFWKNTGKIGMKWLTGLLNVSFRTAKCRKEVEYNVVVKQKTRMIFIIVTTIEEGDRDEDEGCVYLQFRFLCRGD